MSATAYTKTGLGSVTVLPDGSARIVRAIPSAGLFLSMDLTPDEVAALRGLRSELTKQEAR